MHEGLDTFLLIRIFRCAIRAVPLHWEGVGHAN